MVSEARPLLCFAPPTECRRYDRIVSAALSGLGSPSHIKQGVRPCLWSFSPLGASSTPSGQKRPKGTINNREKCSLGYRNRRIVPQATSTERKSRKELQITGRIFLRPQIKVRKSRRDDRPQAGGERSVTPAMFRTTDGVPKVRQNRLCRPFRA